MEMELVETGGVEGSTGVKCFFMRQGSYWVKKGNYIVAPEEMYNV